MKKILKFILQILNFSLTVFRMSMDLSTSVLSFPPQISYCSCTYIMLFTLYYSGIPMTSWLAIKESTESWIGVFPKNSVKMMQFQSEFEICFSDPVSKMRNLWLFPPLLETILISVIFALADLTSAILWSDPITVASLWCNC